MDMKMAQKEHELNGFYYTHDRHSFLGSWYYDWKYKPTDMSEWCPYSLPSGKTKKNDMVSFLQDKENAEHHYHTWLKEASDVEQAEVRLLSARKKIERISSPDWGGRGNNPDKDTRITRQARDDLASAERALVRARELRERLNKS